MAPSETVAVAVARELALELLRGQKGGLGAEVAADGAKAVLALLVVIAIVAPVVENREVHTRGQVREPHPEEPGRLPLLGDLTIGGRVTPLGRDHGELTALDGRVAGDKAA